MLRIQFSKKNKINEIVSMLEGRQEFVILKGSLVGGAGKEIDIIITHGVTSMGKMKQKIKNLPLKDSFKERAFWITCHGTYMPQPWRRKHLLPKDGVVKALDFYELSDGSYVVEFE